ncbi:MAG: DNA polymerase III subunit beta [Nitrospirae bacterium]|nr:DNA polymerase III subunit beta [Nitrospirota bacterium]MBF0536561.1 DNA polymerase III subunit beta [Nitrospirota bacterium]MBF0618143.1 DNA polymerase III subunit beta [Nitrospirota bacterium]
MNFRIDSFELQKRLSDIQNIIEKKATTPVLSNFLLCVGADGSTIYATDLDMAIKEPVTVASVQKPGKFCLPAKKLYEIAREITGEIVFEETENNWVTIKAGKSYFRIACIESEEYPQWPEIERDKQIIIDARNLLGMIEKTLYSAGEADPRYTLNGVLFHIFGEQKKMMLVGTDSHRLAAIETDIDVPFSDELKLIVPRKTVNELKKFLTGIEGDISFDISANHIRFNLFEKEFLTKLIEGSYPAYDQVIPKNNDKTAVIAREEFIAVLKRVAVINRDKSKIIKIDISENEMEIFANDPELGEARDSMDVRFDGDTLSVGYNSRYLLELLLSMETENVVIKFLDSQNPTLFMEEGVERYRCVIMPVRM